jgi:membrane-associated phospholipid phosphatase
VRRLAVACTPRVLLVLLLLVQLVLLSHPAPAQAAESSTQSKTFFTSRDAALAAGMFGVAASISLLDARIAQNFQDSAHVHVRVGRDLDGVFTHINETTLTVGGLAFYVIGRVFKMPTVEDVSLHIAESVAAASVTSQLIRGPLGRTRPLYVNPQFSDQYSFHFMQGFTRFENRSFPSIHSSSGFAAASAIVAEVHERDPSATWAVGVPAYLLAATPGLSRMYLGQHWASDIVSGALIGTFYGWHVVQYSHAHPRTPVDRLFLHSVDRPENRLTFGWNARF